MAMNLEAVLKIAAQVTGLQNITALEKGLQGAEKAADAAKGGFKAVVNSSAWQAAAAGAAGIGVALGTSVRAAMDFESAMADVKKVVPGLESAAGFAAMKQEILGLSRELPVSAEGLAQIMAAAGQAGIAKEELTEFTKQAAQMGVAFDISAAEAGESMAKLRTALGLNQQEVVSLADAMNYLSNNMASSAAQVNEFMLRAGAVGKQVAMTTEQTAAFGSAMIAAGAAPEVASTSFMNLIRALTKGESATARQSEAFKRLGLDAVQVSKDMQKDAVGTIRDVFMRISKMPAEMRVSTVSEVFGDEARALTPLITNMKLFDQAIGLVADKSKYAGSMLAEFNARAGTSANNWQILQNNIKALQIAIGDGLLPAINLIFKALTPVLSLVADLAGRFPVLTAGVTLLVAGISAFVLLAPGVVAIITLFGQLGITLPVIAGAATVVQVAFATLIGAISSALSGILAWIGTTFIPGLLAFFSGPVGWTVLAIAAVVAMAIAFREPLMKFVQWLWDWGEPIRKFWVDLWAGITDLTTKAFSRLMEIAYAIWVKPWVDLWNNVLREPVTSAWAWIQEKASAAFNALKQAAYSLWVKPWVDSWEAIKGPVRASLDVIRGIVEWFAKAAWAVFDALWLTPFKAAWAAVGDFVRNALDRVRAIAASAWQAIADAFGKYVSAPIAKAWNALIDAIQDLLVRATKSIAKAWDAVGSAFNTYVSQPVGRAWNGLMDGISRALGTARDYILKIWQSISSAFSTYVAQPIGKAWNAIAELLPNTMRKAADFVKGVWTSLVNSVKSVIRGLLQMVVNAINSVGARVNRLISAFNRLPGADIPLVPTLSVPAFAKGGVVSRPTLAMVGEAGQEYIIPEGKMAAASSRYLAGARGADVVPTATAAPAAGVSAPVINITTGPVVEFNGERYVKLEDLDRAARQITEGVFGRLRTPAARIALGMA